jgi:hypothetical protein
LFFIAPILSWFTMVEEDLMTGREAAFGLSVTAVIAITVAMWREIRGGGMSLSTFLTYIVLMIFMAIGVAAALFVKYEGAVVRFLRGS